MVQRIVEPAPGVDIGRVIVEKVDDLRRAQRGEIPADAVHRLTVPALVDSGATFCCMPEALIQQLGLPFNRERGTSTVTRRGRQSTSATGGRRYGVYGGARLTVQGRDCDEEVLALPEDRQVLLGQVPLEKMDWRIDLNSRRPVGNPEHGGHWMAEVF